MSLIHQTAALLVTFIWGTNFVLLRYALDELAPFTLAALRFLFVAFPLVFFLAKPKNSKFKKTNLNYVKPEEVKAFELGYRSVLGKTSIDVNGYYNVYNNFIGNVNVLAPYYGIAQDAPNPTPNPANPGFQSLAAIRSGDYRVYQLYANTDVEIKSFGFGLGLSRKVIRDFEVGVSYNYAQFSFDNSNSNDPGFEASFNTPKHRAKASIGNENLFKNFGGLDNKSPNNSSNLFSID